MSHQANLHSSFIEKNITLEIFFPNFPIHFHFGIFLLKAKKKKEGKLWVTICWLG
jgi:hypothetical protein